MITLSLVLPVHNQADTIKDVVTEIVKIFKKTQISHEIFLVENGSIDTTLDVLRSLKKRFKTVHIVQSPLGYGSAALAGLAKASGTYVSYMPSDGQADVSRLPHLLNVIEKTDADLVKIKRINRENWIRYYNSKIYNVLANILFRVKLADINGSPRIMKLNSLKKLKLEYRDSFIDLEMAIKARYLGWHIIEVPAKDLLRRGGKSTVSIRTVLEFFKNFLLFKTQKKLELFRRNNSQ